jgi:uroporphyrinogen-III synthase
MNSLSGRRVLVTRTLEDSRAWADRLSALGADPVILPCIRVEAIDDAVTRSRLLRALADADWLCVSSVRGVEAVAQLAGPLPQPVRVAAVGDATADAVRSHMHREPFVPGIATSRALGEELLDRELRPTGASRVVVALAESGRTDAEDVLERGGAIVTRVNVYRTIPVSTAPPQIDLAAVGVSDVLLASPSAVQGLINQTAAPITTRIFTIGPTTTAAVLAAGLSVSGEATHPDLESLVEAMQ